MIQDNSLKSAGSTTNSMFVNYLVDLSLGILVKRAFYEI